MHLKYIFQVGGMLMQTQYITAREVVEALGISKGKAYKIIRQVCNTSRKRFTDSG